MAVKKAKINDPVLTPSSKAAALGGGRLLTTGRIRIASIVAAVLLTAGGLCLGQVRVSTPKKPDTSKPIPLVNVDEERAALVKKAQDFIQQKEYLKAIEYLQALAEKSEGKLIADDGKRYVSFVAKANEIIGSMPEDGLALYRQMYDPQAEQLYNQGVANSDLGLLRQVAMRYANSSYGGKTLNIIGSILFDAGKVEQASRFWRLALDRRNSSLERPVLLAKLYAAYHLSGQAAKAAEVAKELSEKHAAAEAKIAGRLQKISDFLAEVAKMPPVTAPPVASADEWGGLGAQKMGQGLMGESNVVLSPRWQNPPVEVGKLSLVAMGQTFKASNNPNQRVAINLKNGHVSVGFSGNGSSQSGFTMAPLVQPVVYGDVVIYRRDDAVVACDLVTGEQRWITVNLPLERENKSSERYGGYYGNMQAPVDTGRYTLTLAEGKVFALANYRASTQNYGGRRDGNDAGDTSDLVALSLKGQLKQVWRLGQGVGKDEIVRGCRYMCAPTYDAGRLYTVVAYAGNYQLLCLDAANGSLQWQAMVCQTPPPTPNYGYDPAPHRGSPPAVADGRVYVATNAGVVAAFEADTGQPAWAYQYDSPHGMLNNPNMGYNPNPGPGYPGNPIIVAGSKVVALPADSQTLLVLSADDGTLLKQMERSGKRDLTAIDTSRVLLSGPSMEIVSLTDMGRKPVGSSETVVGRPAVTPSAILASGSGRLIRVDLTDPNYPSKPLPLVAGDGAAGMLGNLLSVRGQLIAANAGGLCGYLNYADARSRLSERLEAAPAKNKPDLLLSRAQLAFSSRNFSECLADLLAAKEIAAPDGNVKIARIETMLYRTYVALADHGTDPNAMEQNYLLADSVAATPQEKGHMKVRLAKFHRLRADQIAAAIDRDKVADAAEAAKLRQAKITEATLAVQLAQELREQFGSTELADVEIGPGQENALMGPSVEYIVGSRLGENLIRDLLQTHGQQIYAAYDAQAKEALDGARAANDANAMADISRRWPNSLWSDNARLLAGELLYRRSLEEAPEQADRSLSQIVPLLSPLTAETVERALRVNAHVGLAAVYGRNNQRGTMNYHCDAAREAAGMAASEADIQVAFGDLQGSLETVLTKLQGPHEGPVRQARLPAMLRMPLTKIFEMTKDNTCILRDQNYQPLRLGDRILVLSNNHAIMADTQARDAASAVSWQGLSPITSDALRQGGFSGLGTGAIAALSKDQKVLTIASNEGIRGYDLRTAKAKWARTLAEPAVGAQGNCLMGTGDGLLALADGVGRIICIDMATGEVLWNQVQLAVGNPMMTPPQVGGGLVMIRHSSMRQVTLLDVAQKGRIIQTFQGQASSVGCFTPTGVAIVCSDNKVTALDPGQVSKPLWSRTYDNANSAPTILGVSPDYAAFTFNSRRVDICSVTAGKEPLVSLPAPTAGSGGEITPIYAVFDGSSAYIACSSQFADPRQWGTVRPFMGLWVAKVDLERKKYAWVSEVVGNNANLLVTPPVAGQTHVAVAVTTGTGEDMVYVLDVQTGKIASKIAVARKGGADNVAAANALRMGRMGNRQFMMMNGMTAIPLGPPVMTNGRLAIETNEGVVIYGAP